MNIVDFTKSSDMAEEQAEVIKKTPRVATIKSKDIKTESLGRERYMLAPRVMPSRSVRPLVLLAEGDNGVDFG